VDHSLIDPVSGEELATISSAGVDMNAALEYARQNGSPNLQALTYQQRAELLERIAEVLSAHRAEYFEISRRNLGATEADAAFDVDGAIYTVKQYAKLGQALAGNLFKDGSAVPLSKSGAFRGQHFLKPLGGVAIFINAFNFPAWGLWEKAAPAILSGVAVLAKPASPTAWLTQRLVEDIVKAAILPSGTLSIFCGSERNLLEHAREDDAISLTGSAQTAVSIRTHPNIAARSVRVNIEADSLNSAILGPDAAPGGQLFDLLVKEVVREMTLKAGQKCTAIRRVLVSREHARPLAKAISDRLANVKVGNPRNKEVQCGPLVNKAQQISALEGVKRLQREAEVVFGGSHNFQPVDADRRVSCFVEPTLLFCEKPLEAEGVNKIEVFGPVATILPYDSVEDAVETAKRGSGSLVASVFSDDPEFKRTVVLGIANMHGRIMVVDGTVNTNHTGHGNVVPTCLHGGPGRAGGGEELAGLRALNHYHRRFVVQGSPDFIADLAQDTIESKTWYE
jgi:3,4-dehydroadipyl-CoA semialdehyde dehydrogenase